MAGELELVKFVGGVKANGHIDGHGGWRGHSTVTVGREGIDFACDFSFRGIGHRYVEHADLAYLYPVQPRRVSLSRLMAAIFPHMSKTAIRFVTQPVGRFKARDDYTFFPDNGTEVQLIDLLEELGYPVDRRLRTMRLLWQDEV